MKPVNQFQASLDSAASFESLVLGDFQRWRAERIYEPVEERVGSRKKRGPYENDANS